MSLFFFFYLLPLMVNKDEYILNIPAEQGLEPRNWQPCWGDNGENDVREWCAWRHCDAKYV